MRLASAHAIQQLLLRLKGNLRSRGGARMHKSLAAMTGILVLSLFYSSAANATCTFHTFTSGSPAYASDVNDNFSYLLNCAGMSALNVGPGSLTVTGTTNTYATAQIHSHGGTGNGYGSHLDMINTDGIQAQLNMSDSGDGTAYYTENAMLTLSTGSGFGIKINTNATDNNGLRIATSGATSCYPSCSNVSDRRIKTKIAALEQAKGLDAIAALTPVSYYWKDRSKGAGQQIGLIAQDVRNVFPQVVINTGIISRDTPDGTLSLNYGAMTAPIVLSIQQLNARTKDVPLLSEKVAALAAENQRLTAELHQLRKEFSALEHQKRSQTAQLVNRNPY